MEEGGLVLLTGSPLSDVHTAFPAQPRSMKHSVKDLFGSHGKFMERTYLTHMTASDSWPLAPPSICGVT